MTISEGIVLGMWVWVALLSFCLAGPVGRCFILLGCAVCFAWLVHVSDWQWAYALQYDVKTEQVTVDSKPHDCEWGASPIGNKNCHYERVISTFHRSVTPDGRHLVSFDNRKTWSVDDGLWPAFPSVTVSWSKIND